MSSTQQFSCLYTKHKTQKRRVWHDGRLVVSGGRARLFSAQPTSADPLLDECDFSESQPMETERFLIQIEGPWVKATTDISTTLLTGSGPSTHLPKILGRKFQPPQRIIPPLHRSKHGDMVLGKRKRPLQPGELEQLHYGSNGAQIGSLSRPSPSTIGLHHGNSQSDFRPTATSVHQNGTGVLHSLQPQLQHQTPNPMVPSGVDSSRITDRTSHHPKSRIGPSPDQIRTENEAFHTHEAGPLSSQQDRLGYAATPIVPTTVPDAFVVGGTNKNRTRLGNLPFVSNNFNDREYYGLEEEEEEAGGTEDQENTERILDQLPIHDSRNPFMTLPFMNKPDNNACPMQAPADTAADPAPALAPLTKPKTTNELFALFGAVPLVHCPSTRQETSDPMAQTVENDIPGTLPHDTDQVRFYLPSPPHSDSDSSEQDQDNTT